MGMKDTKHTHAQAYQDRLYRAMDENLGWKEPIKKKEDSSQEIPIQNIPTLCTECKLKNFKCWIGKIRQQGNNFNCSQRMSLN